MNKSQYDSKLSTLINEGRTLLIAFDVEEKQVAQTTTSEESEEAEAKTKTVYEAYSVRVSQPISRESIISTIVEAAYPQDKMQAIINNHLVNLATIQDGGTLDADDEEHETEYKAMQEWRTLAKQTAAEAMEAYRASFV